MGIEGTKYSGECDGRRLALTPDLYSQGYEKFKDATCIPDYAFCTNTSGCAGSPGLLFTGDVNLTNMGQLVYVGISAFNSFKGKLSITGSFPKLKEIKPGAFQDASNAYSSITLDGVAALEMVGDRAFHSFKGKMAMTGLFPKLKAIGVLQF